MESELTSLIESLRTGANRLDADLQLLEGNLTEVGEAVTPRRTQFEPEEPEPRRAAGRQPEGRPTALDADERALRAADGRPDGRCGVAGAEAQADERPAEPTRPRRPAAGAPTTPRARA